MSRSRITILFFTVLLIAAGSVGAQQQEPLTPARAAIELSSKWERDSLEFSDFTRAAAISSWKRGNIDAAFAQAEKAIPDTQLQILAHFASIATEKRADITKRALTQALKVMPDRMERSDRDLVPFVRSAAAIGEFDTASKFAELLYDGSTKASALLTIAEQYAERGQKDKAIELIDQAQNQFDSLEEQDVKYYLADLTAQAVKLLVRLDESNRISKLTNRASQLLVTHSHAELLDELQLAVLFARGSDPAAVISLASASHQDLPLIDLALMYDKLGQESAALSCLARARQQAESGYDRDLRRIVQTYIKIGHLNEGVDVLRDMTYNFDLRGSAVELAGAFKEQGQKREAISALDIAFARIKGVVSEKSEDIPGHASTSLAKEKSDDLAALCAKYVELGELRAAEDVANEIDQPQHKASALAGVAVAYVRTGDGTKAKGLLARALKISTSAEHYNQDEWSERTLSRIVEAYADSGFKQEAANVVERYLRQLMDHDLPNDTTITELIEMGLLIEAKELPLNKQARSALKQLVKKLEEDQ